MDYRKQQAYLRSSRVRGIISVFILLLAAAACVITNGPVPPRLLIVFVLVTLALAGSIYYTPDYLHLTVAPDKAARWQVKIRWRIIPAALLLAFAASSTTQDRMLTVVAVFWLATANLRAPKLTPARYTSLFFWITDLVLLGVLLFSGWISLPAGALLVAAATHLAVATSAPSGPFATRAGAWAVLTVVFSARVHHASVPLQISCGGLVLTAASATLWLVLRAERHNSQNIAAAMSELVEFTGYTPERIRRLWETSNQQLAKNWEQAAIPHDDREPMAEWYRQNSELYLFAISAYNLEYKRIKSNLKVIRFARGSCLDYGAGNGEILLELARRGNPVTYFDVEGVTMQFARKRAEQHGLTINFARTKDDLLTLAQQRGFDTIFSFDVLEHLPDLPGELTFLSSLLAPGGVFVFDVPAGSTKAHPMHLNHNLDVLEFMSDKGLKDRRTFSLRMPFRKEEKWMFEA